MSLVAGVVGGQQSIDFAGKGSPELVQFVELRSPVRLGDQFTTLDRRYTDTNIDLDGDQKPDTLEVAIFGRVEGVEPIALPNLPELTAVRVDITMRQRVTYSASGQLSPVVEVRVQTWYASGVGIVQQRLTTPTPLGNDYSIWEEQLASWDGVDKGFGAMPPLIVKFPADSPVLPGLGVGYGRIVGAATFADHALVVMSSMPDTGALIARLDNRGRAVSGRIHDTVKSQEGQFVGFAQGLLHLRPSTTASYQRLPVMELTRFDEDGALLGEVGGAKIDLKGGRVDPVVDSYVGAVDGSTLWLLWGRIYNAPTAQMRELVLRPYTLEGSPAGPEVLVHDGQSSLHRMTAGNGRVLFAWVDAYQQAMYGGMALGDQSPVVRTMPAEVPIDTGNYFALTPIALGTSGALVWNSPLAVTPPGGIGGVLLDSGLAPLRTSATSNELLLGAPRLSLTSLARATPDAQRLVFAGDANGAPLLWPDDSWSTVPTIVSWLDLATSPLAATRIRQVRTVTVSPRYLLVFDDRVIMLDDTGGLRSTLVWLNSGGSLQ
ncbi:MAG: hypothetical protein KA185_14025 [Vitreoscilla sp.]|nr:hypothetical protein [Vitreoscilla sp.]